jgi:hypothetical protein
VHKESLMNATSRLIFALAFAIFSTSLGIYRSSANTIDVGFSNNWDCTFACVDRMQQVYDSSLFAGTTTISQVSFFVADVPFTWNGSTWQMSLSTSPNTLGTLDPVFANNVGGDNAIFGSLTPTGSPSINSLVTFTGSFTYDPSQGDLLVDVVRTAGISSHVIGLYATSSPGLLDRAYAFNSTVLADGVNQGGYALHTLFEVSVPEPSSVALLGGAVIAFTTFRRKCWPVATPRCCDLCRG